MYTVVHSPWAVLLRCWVKTRMSMSLHGFFLPGGYLQLPSVFLPVCPAVSIQGSWEEFCAHRRVSYTHTQTWETAWWWWKHPTIIWDGRRGVTLLVQMFSQAMWVPILLPTPFTENNSETNLNVQVKSIGTSPISNCGSVHNKHFLFATHSWEFKPPMQG